MYESGPAVIERIKARAAQERADAATVDTSRTETVTAADLAEGDVVLSVAAQTFPFPFTMSAVQPNAYGSVALRAAHGWFSVLPIPAAAPAVRVVR